MNTADEPVDLTPFESGDTYSSSHFGDWVYSEACPLNPNCGEWLQRRRLPGSASDTELRLLATRGMRPDTIQLAWACHVLEEHSHFLHTLGHWGPTALQKLAPSHAIPGGRKEFGSRLQLAQIIIPIGCFRPHMAHEYDLIAHDPLLADYEFCSRWRALEPICIEARNSKTPGAIGQVWLSPLGEPVDKRHRRGSDWEDFDARR